MDAARYIDNPNDTPIPDINPVCSRMLNCRITGNITPISWYRCILTKSGKPDVVAITLLSDIIYWYMPIMTRDEHTGDVIGIKQKFKADKLQKTYQEYVDIFGFSKSQIKAAMDNLCDQDLITREFRHLKTPSGLPMNNVMYIEPILENIVKISNKIRSPQKVRGYPPKKLGDTPPKKQGGTPQKNGGTNTDKPLTQITTTTTTPAAAVDDKNLVSNPIRQQIPDPYRSHRDVTQTLSKYLTSHGPDYVSTELDYAKEKSTKQGGFPAFLKRSLANGWGTENLKAQQVAETERQEQERLRQEREREASLAEQQRMAEIEAQDRLFGQKIQQAMEDLSPSELGRIKAEALTEAEQKTPKLRGQHGQMLAAAKEKLAAMPDHERDQLYDIAKAAVKASIGGLIGQNHPGYQRIVDNQVLREIQERYPFKTPLVGLWREKVKTEAKRIVKALIVERYGISRFDQPAEVT